jgi:hypothetical protein
MEFYEFAGPVMYREFDLDICIKLLHHRERTTHMTETHRRSDHHADSRSAAGHR